MAIEANEEDRQPSLRVSGRVSKEALDGAADIACIDGRHSGAIVGAPGGDAGELLLVLSALEAENDQQFGLASVEAILETELEAHGRFYLHTDEHALNRLQASLEAREDVQEWLEDVEDFEAWVAEPPRPVRGALLQELVRPEHVGCGHLNTMLKQPESAGLRRELVEHVIQAFFKALWSGAEQPDFVVLEGGHHEAALILFEGGAEDFEATGSAPAVEPADQGEPFFVVHMPARRHVWRRQVRFLEQEVDLPGFEIRETDALLERIELLAERQIKTTVLALAPDLPMWEATEEDGKVSLERGEGCDLWPHLGDCDG